MSTNTTHLDDAEFGTVRVRRNRQAKYVRLHMQPNGDLIVTLPVRASLRHAERLIDTSRDDIRRWRETHLSMLPIFTDGSRVGHSHTVHVYETPHNTPSVRTDGLSINVYVPAQHNTNDLEIQQAILPHIEKAIQKEARAYLPRRLRYLANTHGFSYQRTRFGTPKGRWGSCSSTGTISLNVGLMLLDDTLIDYVLVHELCHTRQMNHSPTFWSLVETCLPDYKQRRTALKKIQPIL